MTLISMSSRRGLLAGAAVLALSAGTLQAQEVTVWFWDTNFNGAAMQAAADRYAAINPDVTITLVDLAKVDLEQNLQTQLASGVTEGLPDIVLVDDLRAQIYLQSFPGAFAPLNDHIDYSQFAAYKIGVATVDGLTYSLPFDSGVAGFFYRSDILAEAGYGAADLEDITWNRFLEIAKDVTAKTGHQMFSHNVDNPSPIRMMLQSAGSWYFTPEGELDLVGNPVFRETLETWGEILRATEIWKPTSGWSDYTGAFTSGEVASVPFTGVWITGTIKSATDQAGLWAVAPVPRLDVEGSVNATNYGGSSWYVLDSSPERDAAIDFLAKVWASDVDFYQDILVGQGAFATYLPARDGAAYSSSDDFFGGQPVWQNFSDWVAEIPPVSYGIFANEVDAAITAQFPALQAGEDLDGIIAAIDAQARAQMQ